MRRLLAQALLGRKVTADYTLSDMARDVAGVLDALHLPSAHVVGVSMGGMIAQTLAIEHAPRVRSLVSMHSTPGERGHAGSFRALGALLGATPRSKEEAQERVVRLFRVIGSPGFARDEVELRARVAKVWDRAPMSEGGFARQWAAVLASGSRTRRLAGVACPTLVVHGADDPLVPISAGQATARAIPGADLHVYHGLGHDIPYGFVPTLADSIAEHARRADARDVKLAPAGQARAAG
jgi:pimeloyl-ACP methyl ester carboxylesterase